jgi:hypothetical protein
MPILSLAILAIVLSTLTTQSNPTTKHNIRSLNLIKKLAYKDASFG